MRNDFDSVAEQLSPTLNLHVRAAAPERGDRLAPGSAGALPRGPYDAVFVIADGLSQDAVRTHAVPTVMAATARLLDWNLGPVVLAENALIGLGDEIGTLMNASMVVVLIGERAGPTAVESLAAYVTHAPLFGRHPAERHCISNIHRGGLSYAEAADKLERWMSRARPASHGDWDLDAADTLGPDSIDKLLDSTPGKLRSSKK